MNYLMHLFTCSGKTTGMKKLAGQEKVYEAGRWQGSTGSFKKQTKTPCFFCRGEQCDSDYANPNLSSLSLLSWKENKYVYAFLVFGSNRVGFSIRVVFWVFWQLDFSMKNCSVPLGTSVMLSFSSLSRYSFPCETFFIISDTILELRAFIWGLLQVRVTLVSIVYGNPRVWH